MYTFGASGQTSEPGSNRPANRIAVSGFLPFPLMASKDAVQLGANPEDPHEAHGRDFINQGSRFMVLDNASKVVEPLLVLLCARYYAGGEWGFFKYYESILMLLARVAVAGMDRGVVWIHARRDEAGFLRVFSRAMNCVLLLAAGLALLAGAQWIGWLPSWGRFADGAPGATDFNVACFLIALPLQAGTLLFIQALINKRRLLQLLLIRNIAMPLLTLGPALALAFTPWREHGLAVPYLCGAAAGFLLGLAFFAKAYNLKASQWAWSASVPREMLRFSLPIASTDVFMSFAYRVDIILLGRFAGLGAVEVYSVIMMISRTLNSIRQSFDGILLSVFSRSRSTRPTPAQVRHFNYAAWIVLTLQLPFLPLALLFGGDLLGLIGPTYATGHAVLAVAVFFNIWITLGNFSDQFVAGMGKTHIIPVSRLVFFGSSVGLNFLFIPHLGATGAALATGLATLVGGAINFGAIWFYNRGFFLLPDYWRPFVTGFAMLSPAMAAGLWLDLGMAPRLVLLLASLGLFVLHARARWKRFNPA
jgi:O-antigen/teichoic acid export membrane protein